jgi:hypothetical protein
MTKVVIRTSTHSVHSPSSVAIFLPFKVATFKGPVLTSERDLPYYSFKVYALLRCDLLSHGDE